MCCSTRFLQSVLFKMAFGLTWFIHPLEKQQSLQMGGRRVDAWWAGAGFSWDTVPVLGLCQAGPSEHLPDLTSWKQEEMGESGLNNIWSKSIWRPQTSQPMKVFLSLPLCVHWGKSPWVGGYWSLQLEGQMSASSHPPSLFISLLPTLPANI